MSNTEACEPHQTSFFYCLYLALKARLYKRMWGSGYGTSLKAHCPLYWTNRAPEAHTCSVRSENHLWPWEVVILPCRGVCLWWQICSHFMWKRGGRTDLSLVTLCSGGCLMSSFTSPFAPYCFLWSLPPVVTALPFRASPQWAFDGPFGTPANRTAWNSPCSPPSRLVQQNLQAGSNSNTSIHFCNALIFRGSDHNFQMERSLSLEVKLPVLSVPWSLTNSHV